MWSGLTVRGYDVSRFLDLDRPSSATLEGAFLGSKRVRYGHLPCPENYDHLSGVLQRCQREDRPVDVLTMWGAAKGYGLFPLRTADFLDLMALKRLACLQNEVRRFHRPGVRVVIVWEDFTEQVLTGHTGTEYLDTFVQLTQALGLSFVDVVRESALIEDGDFLKLCLANAEAIASGREAEVGWTGEIAWGHYLSRCASEHPDLCDGERREKVALYLGITLARYQRRIVPPHHVKLSFVPYPASVPDSMRKCRVEYKVKPGKNSNRTIAPWCGFGLIRGDDWSHVSVRELRASTFDLDHTCVNGVELPLLVADTGCGAVDTPHTGGNMSKLRLLIVPDDSFDGMAFGPAPAKPTGKGGKLWVTAEARLQDKFVGTPYNISDEERAEMLALLDQMRATLAPPTVIPSAHVQTVTVTDPDSGLPVEVEIRKLETGGMVGFDGSYLEQLGDGENPNSPYDDNAKVHVPDDEQ